MEKINPELNVSVEERVRMADDPNTKFDDITALTQDPEVWVRSTLVKRKGLSPYHANIMARDPNARIRSKVAFRINIWDITLTLLKADKSKRVERMLWAREEREKYEKMTNYDHIRYKEIENGKDNHSSK